MCCDSTPAFFSRFIIQILLFPTSNRVIIRIIRVTRVLNYIFICSSYCRLAENQNKPYGSLYSLSRRYIYSWTNRTSLKYCVTAVAAWSSINNRLINNLGDVGRVWLMTIIIILLCQLTEGHKGTRRRRGAVLINCTQVICNAQQH